MTGAMCAFVRLSVGPCWDRVSNSRICPLSVPIHREVPSELTSLDGLNSILVTL